MSAKRNPSRSEFPTSNTIQLTAATITNPQRWWNMTQSPVGRTSCNLKCCCTTQIATPTEAATSASIVRTAAISLTPPILLRYDIFNVPAASQTIHLSTPSATYDIHIGRGLLASLHPRLVKLAAGKPFRPFLITSPNIWKL